MLRKCCRPPQNFVGVDASTFSVAVQQQRRLLGISGGSEVLIEIKALPDFHREMMRLGSTFSDYPRRRGGAQPAVQATAQQ